jgi:hypothetical protein
MKIKIRYLIPLVLTWIFILLLILSPYEASKFSLGQLLEAAFALLSLLFIFFSQYFVFIALQLCFLISSKLFLKNNVLVYSLDIVTVILMNIILAHQIRFYNDFPKVDQYYIRWNLYYFNLISSIVITVVTILVACIRYGNNNISFDHSIKRKSRSVNHTTDDREN